MVYSGAMSKIGSYLMGGERAAGCRAACSDNGPKNALFIRTSEQGSADKMNKYAMLRPVLSQTSERNRQKRARTRAECVTIPKRGHQNMLLTLGGLGGSDVGLPTPGSAKNRLQTRKHLKIARKCTETYSGGLFSNGDDVSSDLARFQRRFPLKWEAVLVL